MVEWKKLGDIANITIGEFVHRDKQNPNAKYPVYNGGTTYTGFYDKYNNTGNKIIISARGYAGFVNRVFDNYWAGNSSYSIDVINKNVIWHYVYYYLKNEQYNIMSMQQKGGGLAAISKKQVQGLLIPIPSLEEQNRIVGILDTFTDSIENLKQQIAQRKKQYTYLIDNAFGGSLSEMKKKAEDGILRIEPLSAHGTFTRGRRFVRTDVVEEGQPCIHYGDMYTFYGLSADKANTHLPYDFPKKMRYAKKGDVVIVGAGENNEDIAVGLVWLGDEPAAVHDACYIYESDFEPMFLSYFLRSSIYHLQIKSHVVRGKICSISSDGIGKALIPVYTMEKQKEIVSKLLPFESLLNNLEAQLEQRQKQYEYYRNKLLTFE